MPLFETPLVTGTPNVGDRAMLHRLLDEMLDRRQLTNGGPLVQQLEERIADYLGVKHCIAVCNGTVAIEIAARAMDLRGEVILPSFTFVASAHALSWVGLTPVFCDVDPATYCIDPQAAQELINDRTCAIMGVHVYGRACPTSELDVLATQAGIKLLYDAAHAFGCTALGRSIGSFGACETFSFHATKFFNTFEGGAITTDDDALAEECRRARSFGFTAGSRVSASVGTNGKMSEASAAMGLVSLDAIDGFIEVNRRNYEAYRDGLAGVPGLRLLEFEPNQRSNYQYVVVDVSEAYPISRDRLLEQLAAENVIAQRYFWPGCHRMEPYSNASIVPPLPNTETSCDRVLVLPTGTAVTPDDAARIAAFMGNAD